MPPLIGSHHAWALVWGLSLLLFMPKIFLNKFMILVMSYGIYLYLMTNIFASSMDPWNVAALWREYYQLAMGVSIITYFEISQDYSGLAKLIKYTLFFILITAVMTLISSIIDPLYARNLGAASIANKYELKDILELQKFGGGSYGTAIAFMSILPVLIYFYKHPHQSPIRKFWIIVIISLTFIALFRMQIFANIMFAIFISMLSIVGAKNRKRIFLIIGFAILFIFIIPTSIYSEFFYYLSKLFSESIDISFKFQELGRFIEYGGNYMNQNNVIAGRAGRYPLLFLTFIKSPIFGCYFMTNGNEFGYNGIGAHLFWMNKITTMGITGFFFYIYILYAFIKKQTKKMMNEDFKFYIILSMMTIIFYGLLKVIGGRESWYTFFILLPGMYYLPLLKKEKTEEYNLLTNNNLTQ